MVDHLFDSFESLQHFAVCVEEDDRWMDMLNGMDATDHFLAKRVCETIDTSSSSNTKNNEAIQGQACRLVTALCFRDDGNDFGNVLFNYSKEIGFNLSWNLCCLLSSSVDTTIGNAVKAMAVLMDKVDGFGRDLANSDPYISLKLCNLLEQKKTSSDLIVSSAGKAIVNLCKYYPDLAAGDNRTLILQLMAKKMCELFKDDANVFAPWVLAILVENVAGFARMLANCNPHLNIDLLQRLESNLYVLMLAGNLTEQVKGFGRGLVSLDARGLAKKLLDILSCLGNDAKKGTAARLIGILVEATDGSFGEVLAKESPYLGLYFCDILKHPESSNVTRANVACAIGILLNYRVKDFDFFGHILIGNGRLKDFNEEMGEMLRRNDDECKVSALKVMTILKEQNGQDYVIDGEHEIMKEKIGMNADEALALRWLQRFQEIIKK